MAFDDMRFDLSDNETNDMTFYFERKVELSILIKQLEIVLETEIDSLFLPKEDSPVFLMDMEEEEGFPLMISIIWKNTYTIRLDSITLARFMAKKLKMKVVTFLPLRLDPTQNPDWYFIAYENGSSWKIKEDLALVNCDGLFLDDATKIPLDAS